MMKSKVLWALALAVIVGCGSTGETAKTETKETEATSGGEFKVALLTLGSVNDSGWNSMAYEALNGIKSDMSATVDNQEVPPTNAKDALRSYAQKGYNLVFGHGYEYNEPMAAVGPDFKDTIFISSSGGKTASNVGAFRFYLEQSFYLAGMLAAKQSKTGVIGSVAVLDIPSINSTLKAYEAGAKAANPNIKVLPPVYFGVENDIAKAKQLTESIIAQKADFVIHQANAAAKGVFDACAEKGVSALGSNLNQNSEKGVVASAFIVAKPAFLQLAKSVKDKTFKGEIVLVGMDSGTIDFEINPEYKSKVPADLIKLLDETKENIRTGKLVVPKDEF